MKRLRKIMGPIKYRLWKRLGIAEVSQRRLRRFAGDHQQEATRALVGTPSHFCSLAVVVPVYGHARFLETTLASVRNQSRWPDEVILVEDASPDNSFSALQEITTQWPRDLQNRVRLLHNSSNLGQSASINLGISTASSTHIMILNDDDYLFHDIVEVMYFLFGKHPDLHLIGSTAVHFQGAGSVPPEAPFILSDRHPGDLFLDIRPPSEARKYRNSTDLNMTHSGSTFSKAAWEVVGGYCPRRRRRWVRSSDRDFQLRVNSVFSVGVSTIVPFCYWRSDSSVDADVLS